MPKWLDVTLDIVRRLNTYTEGAEPPKQEYETVIVDSQPEDPRSKNFITLETFDSIEYDSTYLWVCQLDGAPEPFSKWFPAQNITEPTKGVSVSPMSFGIEEINLLNAYSAVTLRAELLDNDRAVLETWLKNWQKNIAYSNNGMDYVGFRYLDETLHKLYITKYTWQKEKVYTNVYYVLPTGDIQIMHDNDPNLKILNVNFAVFGSNSINVNN